MACVGLDVGSTKTMSVRNTGEIIRNELGGHSTASLVSFSGAERLLGESAVLAASSSPKNTVGDLHTLIGQTADELAANPMLAHAMWKLQNGDIELEYNWAPLSVKPVHLLAMLLAKIGGQAVAGTGPDDKPSFAVALPAWMGASQRQALRDAATIAGLAPPKLSLVTAGEALAAVLAFKHPLLADAEPQRVLLVDHGHTHFSLVVALIKADGTAPEVLADTSSAELGLNRFDLKIFGLLAAKCESKAGVSPKAGTKPGQRLMRGVERIRKLLSTMPEAQAQVENLANDADVNLSMSRAELAECCGPLYAKMQAFIAETLVAAGIEASALGSVELLGGGTRMPSVQDALTETLGTSAFGHRLDDAALALGSALVTTRRVEAKAVAEALKASGAAATSDAKAEGEGEGGDAAAPVPAEGEEGAAPPPAPAADAVDAAAAAQVDVEEEEEEEEEEEVAGGLSAEEIASAIELEATMKVRDEEVQKVAAAKNAIEAFIFEMRAAPNSSHGGSIDKDALETILGAAEEWMWSEEADAADSEGIAAKHVDFKAQAEAICTEYFAAVAAEKAQKEKQMEEEAARGAAERAAEGDDGKAQHDTRKLSKPDRMRKVQKHKDNATELFKGKNYIHATKAYKEALTHCSHFFDLSPEDQEEVNGVKLALYNNLALCWTKLDNFDQVFKCASEALALDDKNTKALFRRATVYEKRKQYDLALADIKLAKAQPAGEGDKNLATLEKRVNMLIAKDKAKEKKMAAKMFG